MTSAVEPVLLAALDAEWAVQSERTRPLTTTLFVREALELAVAGSPQGIFGLAGVLSDCEDTPSTFVRRVSEFLPAAPDPWTLRLLGRMRSLPSSPEPLQLEPPAAEPVLLELAPAPMPAPTPIGIAAPPAPPRRRWGVAATLASGAVGGLALAVAAWLAGTGG